MKIILIGYNGLIGSHILKELAISIKKISNFSLFCVSRDIKNQPFKNKNIKYIKWNFKNFNKSQLNLFNSNSIIINCVGKNYSNSKNLNQINIKFIKNLINHLNVKKFKIRFIQLGSISVYGAEKKYFGRIKNIYENSSTYPMDLYSKSKLKAELLIKNFSKFNRKNFSYTILRIGNVYSDLKNTKSFRLVNFLLQKGIWIKCSDNSNYHFVNVKDIALVILICLNNLKKTKNKIYNITDEINQYKLHKIYAKKKSLRLIKIPISLKIINIIIKNIKLPKLIENFFFTISSQINYKNVKFKEDLKFNYKYSLLNE